MGLVIDCCRALLAEGETCCIMESCCCKTLDGCILKCCCEMVGELLMKDLCCEAVGDAMG